MKAVFIPPKKSYFGHATMLVHILYTMILHLNF